MEDKPVVLLHGKDENMIANEEETGSTQVDGKGVGAFSQGAPIGNAPTSAEVNMEAHIIADDIIRAGGFGARDDISSFLRVASDSTDFEATIRDAREYEEAQEEISRPGLGWREATRTK